VGENHGVNSGVVAMSAIAALVVAVALGVGHGAVARGLVAIVPATCLVVCHCSLFALLWCGACLVWYMHVSCVVHACVECGACMCPVWCMHVSCGASGHAPVRTLCRARYAAHLMLRTSSFAASPCGVDNEEVLCMWQAATTCQPRIWVGIEA